jgi:hypothetical protein
VQAPNVEETKKSKMRDERDDVGEFIVSAGDELIVLLGERAGLGGPGHKCQRSQSLTPFCLDFFYHSIQVHQ